MIPRLNSSKWINIIYFLCFHFIPLCLVYNFKICLLSEAQNYTINGSISKNLLNLNDLNSFITYMKYNWLKPISFTSIFEFEVDSYYGMAATHVLMHLLVQPAHRLCLNKIKLSTLITNMQSTQARVLLPVWQNRNIFSFFSNFPLIFIFKFLHFPPSFCWSPVRSPGRTLDTSLEQSKTKACTRLKYAHHQHVHN